MRILLSMLILALLKCSSTDSRKLTAKPEPGKNYKIAYNVLYDAEADNYEVFIMDMDGSNKKNLSNWKGVDWVYYAYKDKIYFISDRDTTHRIYYLYEMDADGNNVRKVADYRLDDSWLGSRMNGTEFIINPHRSVDSTAFYIVNRDGRLLQKVHTGLKYFSDPIFSPDGNKIVFRGANKENKKMRGYREELYMMDLNQLDLKRLTQYPPRDTTAPWYSYKAGPPRWNQQENIITYQSKQSGKYSLFAVSPDGTSQRKLTTNEIQEGWHDWSSDGRWLAIEVFDMEEKAFNIALMERTTGQMKILTDTTYKYQQAPVFVETD